MLKPLKQMFSKWIRMLLIALFISVPCSAQPHNIDNLLDSTIWNTLFPKRAGTFGVHPQGYTSDFYSFNNLRQAVYEMSDYLVQIRRKGGIPEELITITIKSTSVTYIYSDVSPAWYASTLPETITVIDFEDFVNRGSAGANNSRELAAFLAHISKETTGGWQLPIGGGSPGDYAQWGLYFVHEVGYNSTNGAGTYSQPSTEYPPNPAVGYYGRGPIQLSWNYNYGQFSKFLFNDKFILLNNPDSVQQSGVLAFKSAIWFWMMPQCPKPSCHQVMHDLWVPATGMYTASKMYASGFAHTNNIINGGLECRSTSTSAFTDKVLLRSGLYKYYLGVFGFSASQILQEDAPPYSTLCYESPNNAMQDYLNCDVVSTAILDTETSSFRVSPNPVKDVLHVSCGTGAEYWEWQIVDVVGKAHMKGSAGCHDGLFVSTSVLENGSYLLIITIRPDKRVTLAFVVQK